MKAIKINLFAIICLSLSSVIISFHCMSQSGHLSGEITFLSVAPKIDGTLDSNLEGLTIRTLPIAYKYNNENPDVNADYRLAYGTDFFYVYIEADGEELIYRDRAFQNGDGFHMVLAIPKPDNQPTDEFYVLACSAVDRDNMAWTRNVFWYYNVDNIFVRTSDKTEMEFSTKNGKISFELLLPWKDVHPYHPWISESIGFNLCFVKALGDSKNSYKALEDGLGSENSNRKYLKLDFQKPHLNGEPQTFFVLDRNNLSNNGILFGTAATVSEGNTNEDLVAIIRTGENDFFEYGRAQYDCIEGLTIQRFPINTSPIPPGGYKIDWYSRINDSKGENYFTSLPDHNPNSLTDLIDGLKDKISKSSFYTLKHQVQEISQQLDEVKPYETCGDQRMGLSHLYWLIENANNGKDIIAKKRKFVRKAYQSDLDNTLQPYMVYLPENYNASEKYPLIVYLHGSASDETNIQGMKYLIPEDFIGLGPKGRGPSNCYSWDDSQTDISEAINAIIESYSIDTDNIILSGFSMGGYGVYRTYYETPEKYKALAIFSGHPDIANNWSEREIYPDFSRKKYLKVFKDQSMFI